MKLWFGSFRQIAEGVYHLHHDVGFNGVRQVHFLKSEWESFKPSKYVSTKYLTYRIIYMIIVCLILFFSLACSADSFEFRLDADLNFYLIFLTHWSIITQAFYSFIFAIYLVYIKCKYYQQPTKDDEDLLPAFRASQFRLPTGSMSILALRPQRLRHSVSIVRRIQGHVNEPETVPAPASALPSEDDNKDEERRDTNVNDDQGHHGHDDTDSRRLHTHSMPYLCIEHKDEVHVVVFEYAPGRKIVVKDLPVMCKIIWFLFNCTTVLPTFVTLGFWGFVYSPSLFEEGYESWCDIPGTILVHGINVILFGVDFMVVAIPYRLGHFFHLCIYGYIYATFTGFYELHGGPYMKEDKPYIYSFLNWRQKPGVALTATYIALVFATFFFALNTIFYSFRIWLVSKKKHNAMHEHEYEFDWIHKPRRRRHTCLEKLKKCCSFKSTQVTDQQREGGTTTAAAAETMEQEEEEEAEGSTLNIMTPEELELLSKLPESEREKVKAMKRKKKKKHVLLLPEVKSSKSLKQQHGSTSSSVAEAVKNADSSLLGQWKFK